MQTTISNHRVVFANSGNKAYPVNLYVDDLFVGAYTDFQDAEMEAKRIAQEYPVTNP